jgi:hypothetical protein
MKYKVAVVGGGPAGACAAEIFAQEKGIDTVLFERKLDNAKPCGGAIPLCMVGEFDLPETVVDRKVRQEIRCLQLLLLFVRLVVMIWGAWGGLFVLVLRLCWIGTSASSDRKSFKDAWKLKLRNLAVQILRRSA